MKVVKGDFLLWSRSTKIKYLENNIGDEDNPKENLKEFLKGNRSILKTQRFRGMKNNVFTEEVNKVALSTNNNKRIQSSDCKDAYAYGTI